MSKSKRGKEERCGFVDSVLRQHPCKYQSSGEGIINVIQKCHYGLYLY